MGDLLDMAQGQMYRIEIVGEAGTDTMSEDSQSGLVGPEPGLNLEKTHTSRRRPCERRTERWPQTHTPLAKSKSN